MLDQLKTMIMLITRLKIVPEDVEEEDESENERGQK